MNQTEFKVVQIRSGLTKEEIANALSIDVSTLYRKISGKSEFVLSEIRTLKRILGLSNDDVDRIFFNDELA